MFRDVECRKRVLLSVVREPGKCAVKQKEDGTLFYCEAIHFEGEGLVEVFRRSSIDNEDVRVQFSIYGEALAILTLEGERERIFYERDMGYGKREKANDLAKKILKELEVTITVEETLTYYL